MQEVMIDASENEAIVRGEPAPLGGRIAAGVFDLAVTLLIGSLLSLAPLVFGGFALPMLGAFAVIVGYSVVPMALFKATLGMRIFGVQIVNTNGRAADMGELAFRELVGRGMFGAAYFGTVAIGIAGYLSGSMAMFQPTGMGLLLFFLSGFLLLLSGIGHLMILLRPDHRGFPDLIAKTIVVRRGTAKDPAEALDLDEEERKLEAKKRTARAVKFGVFAVTLLAATVLAPWAISRPSNSADEFADRVKLASAQQAFNARPEDPYAARELIYKLEQSGDTEKAEEVRTRHRAAIGAREKTKEDAIRASLARDPKDWDALGSLLELLEEQGRFEEGKAAFAAYVAADPSPDTRASYGVWLYQNDFNADAVRELRKSMAEGYEAADVRAYLGFALLEQDKKEEARDAFEEAIERDPELTQAAEELAALEEELGPSTRKQKKAAESKSGARKNRR
jgi:uncharacterized RDD family membrane protein YckC/Flp pilus assembly protein TadD